MTALERAVLGLQQALDAPRHHGGWRRLVRNRMSGVRDALAAQSSGDRLRDGDAWLTAREDALARDRTALVARLAALGVLVLQEPDVEQVRAQLLRLVADLERHGRKLNDLVYDSVSLELGGSE